MPVVILLAISACSTTTTSAPTPTFTSTPPVAKGLGAENCPSAPADSNPEQPASVESEIESDNEDLEESAQAESEVESEVDPGVDDDPTKPPDTEGGDEQATESNGTSSSAGSTGSVWDRLTIDDDLIRPRSPEEFPRLPPARFAVQGLSVKGLSVKGATCPGGTAPDESPDSPVVTAGEPLSSPTPVSAPSESVSATPTASATASPSPSSSSLSATAASAAPAPRPAPTPLAETAPEPPVPRSVSNEPLPVEPLSSAETPKAGTSTVVVAGLMADCTDATSAAGTITACGKKTTPPDEGLRKPEPSKKLFCNSLPKLRSLPRANNLISSFPQGLYVSVIDGLINVNNRGNVPLFSSGQFGYTGAITSPPIVIPKNPGIQFSPPPHLLGCDEQPCGEANHH